MTWTIATARLWSFFCGGLRFLSKINIPKGYHLSFVTQKFGSILENKLPKNGWLGLTKTSLAAALLYESPKDSLGKCFVLFFIGTHLMKL